MKTIEPSLISFAADDLSLLRQVYHIGKIYLVL
jgi:hypothetical protein